MTIIYFQGTLFNGCDTPEVRRDTPVRPLGLRDWATNPAAVLRSTTPPYPFKLTVLTCASEVAHPGSDEAAALSRLLGHHRHYSRL